MRRLAEEGRPMVAVVFFFLGGGEAKGEDEGRTSYFPLQISHFTRLHARHLNNSSLRPIFLPFSLPSVLSSFPVLFIGWEETGVAESGDMKMKPVRAPYQEIQYYEPQQ